MTGTKKVFRQSFKTLSIPMLKVEEQNGDFGVSCYSIRGGCLYVDGQPVQHYFSRDMFYYEKDGAQYSIFLCKNGLYADIKVKKNGVTSSFKAGSELHYKMTYGTEKVNELDVTFGMGIDSQCKSYYYCGLLFNGKTVIEVPKDEESRKSQKIMSLSYDEKTGNLISKWNTIAYAKSVNESGQKTYPDFFISDISMRFDALYNTCAATISEDVIDIASYDDGQAEIHLNTYDDGIYNGECVVSYTDKDHNKKTVKLIGINGIVTTNDKGEKQTDYYCGIVYNDKSVLNVPCTDSEKKAQHFLSIAPNRKSWIVKLTNAFCETAKKIREAQPDFLITSLTAMGEFVSIIEDQSKRTSYQTTGKIVFGNELLMQAKCFRLNKEQTVQLKKNCMEGNMMEEPLTLELLASIQTPTVIQQIVENGVTKDVVMDGQQYCSYKTADMLTNLAVYFTGDTHNSDSSLNFSNVYGKTRDDALMQINAVNPNIIKEIENAEDVTEGHQKGYLVDFFNTLSPVMLTNALAGQTGKEIDNGYGGADQKIKALQKSRHYMTHTPDFDTEPDLKVLSNQPEYHIITSIIDKYLYLHINSKLQKFMADQTKNYPGQRIGQTAQQYWAEQFYYHCVDTIVLVHATYEINPAQVTNQIKMLSVLDSKSYDIKDSINGAVIEDSGGNKFNSSYSLALYGQLCNFEVTKLVNTYKGAEDYENYCKLLEELFGKFYDKVKNGTIKLPPDLQKDLQKFFDKDRDTFVDWAIFQSETVMQFMIMGGDMMSGIMTYAPTASTFSKLFACFNVLFGMMSFANIFMGWAKMTRLQQAESILAVIQAAFTIGRNFYLWKTVKIMYDLNAGEQARINAYYRYQVSGGTLESLDNISFHEAEGEFHLREKIEKTSTRYSMEMAREGEGRAAFIKSAASKAFVITEIAFNLFNVVLMGIAFVCATIDLVAMFKHKSSYSTAILALSVTSTVLLGISVVLGIAQFALGFTTLATSMMVASVIPGLNCFIFFAILALSITLLIMHKEPTPPITLLISEKIKDKINGLPTPSQKWIDENTPKNLRIC